MIPDEKTLEIVVGYLHQPEYAAGYILDGFPRTVPQAEVFGKDNGPDKVVFIDVSDKEALWRIAGRMSDREDETLQAIRKRIALFHEITQPVLDYYEQLGRLIKVDGEQEVTAVFNEIMKAIKAKE